MEHEDSYLAERRAHRQRRVACGIGAAGALAASGLFALGRLTDTPASNGTSAEAAPLRSAPATRPSPRRLALADGPVRSAASAALTSP